VERNTALENSPELVNADPYGEGWMIVIEVGDAAELEDLLDASSYQQFVEEAPSEA
jgi:glycine cleavage system H protein